VIDFLDEVQGIHGRALGPREGITLHTSNSRGRDVMSHAIRTSVRRHHLTVREGHTAGGKPRFEVEPR
jgi:hypothetical protein